MQRCRHWRGDFVLGRAAVTISVKDILDCVRHGGKPAKAPVEQRDGDNEINNVLAEGDRSATQALEGKSLQSLILALENPAAGNAAPRKQDL